MKKKPYQGSKATAADRQTEWEIVSKDKKQTKPGEIEKKQ